MTCSAVFGGGRVKQNVFSVYLADALVTFGAPHVCVDSFQFECRPSVVLEQRRFPPAAVMTTSAAGNLPILVELRGMRILVTALAVHGDGVKVHVHQIRFQVRWFVTIRASDRTMGSA